MPQAQRHDIIVIGGSMGSTAVLKPLVEHLPSDLPAAVLISTHIPAQPPSFISEVIATRAKLPVQRAVDGQPIEAGHVYVAVPDRHLLVVNGTLRLGSGPRENMVRPAIDALFRSAALSGGSRVIGVVLTGLLNDGASGLHAIKARGGLTVVQHPLDAEEDSMPLAALQAVDVDHVVAAGGLAELLAALAGTPAGPSPAPTDSLRLEVEIAAGRRLGSDQLRTIADPSTLTCPDCQGVLSEVRYSQPLRYRCQIGHSYTAEALASRSERVDEAIRVAMRIMEERVTLVERMAKEARANGRSAVAELHETRAQEYRRYAATLRDAAETSLRMSRELVEQEN